MSEKPGIPELLKSAIGRGVGKLTYFATEVRTQINSLLWNQKRIGEGNLFVLRNREGYAEAHRLVSPEATVDPANQPVLYPAVVTMVATHNGVHSTVAVTNISFGDLATAYETVTGIKAEENK